MSGLVGRVYALKWIGHSEALCCVLEQDTLSSAL